LVWEKLNMFAKRERAGNLLSSGTFWIGMGLIITAPIMNLAYDRMSKARLKGDGSEMLPEFLATLYNFGGTTGVTLLLVAIGVAVLIFGHLRQQLRSQSVVVSHSVGKSAPHAHCDSPADESQPVATASGHMVLQTRKYLS
jgi:hypothetical protein